MINQILLLEKYDGKTRGKWSSERELALVQAYLDFHPFSAQYGQTANAWENILAAVNSIKSGVLTPLTLKGIKCKKDRLFKDFKRVFDNCHNESLSDIDDNTPSQLARAIFVAMKEVRI
ncbi:hypothetical protein CLU79DRAFT_715741 [Phycomyces nitens]|nr:hypothetical protein CLU79DRAFT_715741 [Phycomyces nitens]